MLHGKDELCSRSRAHRIGVRPHGCVVLAVAPRPPRGDDRELAIRSHLRDGYARRCDSAVLRVEAGLKVRRKAAFADRGLPCKRLPLPVTATPTAEPEPPAVPAVSPSAAAAAAALEDSLLGV